MDTNDREAVLLKQSILLMGISLSNSLGTSTDSIYYPCIMFDRFTCLT